MKKNLLRLAVACASVTLIVGCSNIGNAPAGASDADLKKEMDSEPPLQQIRNLQFAPMPPSDKEAKIKEIEQKYGVKREDAMKNLPPVKFNQGGK
jgi:hypothetical protein